jgi:hypothetical protein
LPGPPEIFAGLWARISWNNKYVCMYVCVYVDRSYYTMYIYIHILYYI